MLLAEGFSMKSIMKSGSQRKLEFAGITLLYMVCFTFEQALLRLEKIVTRGKKEKNETPKNITSVKDTQSGNNSKAFLDNPHPTVAHFSFFVNQQ